jgi:hypothetical protein
MSAPSYETGRDDGFLSTHGSLVKQKAVFDLHLYIIELDPGRSASNTKASSIS